MKPVVADKDHFNKKFEDVEENKKDKTAHFLTTSKEEFQRYFNQGKTRWNKYHPKESVLEKNNVFIDCSVISW